MGAAQLGKWDLPGSLTRAELSFGPNILIKEWVPQISVLAHPSVRVFVTQGGVGSMQASILLPCAAQAAH